MKYLFTFAAVLLCGIALAQEPPEQRMVPRTAPQTLPDESLKASPRGIPAAQAPVASEVAVPDELTVLGDMLSQMAQQNAKLTVGALKMQEAAKKIAAELVKEKARADAAEEQLKARK